MKGIFSASGDYVPIHKIPWWYYDYCPKNMSPLICLTGTAGMDKQIMSSSMKLLGDVLVHPCNVAVMIKYVCSLENMKILMNLLRVMFNNRKERSELLEALVISNQDPTIPKFSQRIHLLWGENDEIFKVEHAHNMKQQLGDNVTFQGIKKAGHLVHLERPRIYSKYLNEFLKAQNNSS